VARLKRVPFHAAAGESAVLDLITEERSPALERVSSD
jgi:hypothetical protein